MNANPYLSRDSAGTVSAPQAPFVTFPRFTQTPISSAATTSSKDIIAMLPPKSTSLC